MDMYVGWTTVQPTTGRNPALCLFCLRPLTEMGVRESLRHRHYLRESMGYLGPSHNWRQSLRWQRHSLLWPLTLGHQDLPHCYLETLCLRLLSAAAGQQRGVMGVNYTITYLAFHKYCYFNFFKQLVQDLIIVEYKNKLPINMYIYFFPK